MVLNTHFRSFESRPDEDSSISKLNNISPKGNYLLRHFFLLLSRIFDWLGIQCPIALHILRHHLDFKKMTKQNETPKSQQEGWYYLQSKKS